MTTLMTFKTAENKKGKCDARCYDAKNSECDCCCGGINHGVGFHRAFKHTLNHFEKMTKNSKNVKKNDRLFAEFEFIKKQLSLFGKEIEEDIITRLKD